MELMELYLRLSGSVAVADLGSGDRQPRLSRVNLNLLQALEPLNHPYQRQQQVPALMLAKQIEGRQHKGQYSSLVVQNCGDQLETALLQHI